ncbi:MAG: ribosome maturation factor RimM [Pseudomonadota bacterium]
MKAESLPDENKNIILGKLNAHHGIKGWLKVFSYTDPKQNILSYSQVMLFRDGQENCWKKVEIIDGRLQGKGVVVHIKGYDNREASAELIGSTVVVTRENLEKLPEDDYYWVDLIGSKVINQEGIVLGNIVDMLATPANDVMIVKHQEKPEGIQQEYLIPYVMGQFVLAVDLSSGEIQVDWDVDF